MARTRTIAEPNSAAGVGTDSIETGLSKAERTTALWVAMVYY